MALNLADMIEHTADAVPDRVAIESGDRQVTYAQLDQRANRLAHHLRALGVEPGDKVGLYTRNRIEAVEAMVGILKARAVMVNINFRYVEAELEHLLTDSDAVAVVCEARYADRLTAIAGRCPQLRGAVVIDDLASDTAAETTGNAAEVAAALSQALPAAGYEQALAAADPARDFGQRSADDVFMIYTGGTTGMPKGVMWRHEDVWRVLGGGISITTGEYLPDEWAQSRQGAASPQLVRYPIPPLIHGGSQWAILTGLLTGGKAVVYPEFDAARTWQIVQDHRVSVLFIVGDAMARPMLAALEAGDYDTSSLKALTSSAVQFSPDLKRAYAHALPEVVITDSIGSSETGFSGVAKVTADAAYSAGPRVRIDASTCVLTEDGRKVEPGSGEIGFIARSGHLPLGYYKDEAKTAATFRVIDGVRYAIPGDYATVESDGTVTMLGRGSVSINTGGEKVYPEEVEAALKSHPAVLDALVIGVPDERMGHAVAAVLARRPGTEVAFDELDNHVRTHVSGYKTPRALWWVEQVRRSPAGKPDYRWAASIAAERAPDAASARFTPR